MQFLLFYHNLFAVSVALVVRMIEYWSNKRMKTSLWFEYIPALRSVIWIYAIVIIIVFEKSRQNKNKWRTIIFLNMIFFLNASLGKIQLNVFLQSTIGFWNILFAIKSFIYLSSTF